MHPPDRPLALQRVAASASNSSVAVIGDSITARYNDNAGNAKQGWWSIVGKHYGVKVTPYAQSGSGFQRPGHACTGTIFSQRLKALKKQRPKIVCQWPFVSAHGRPAEMPAGGHENCPVMANRSAHQESGGVGHVRVVV